jgi:hypothetical protein
MKDLQEGFEQALARIILRILEDYTVAHGSSSRQASFSCGCAIYTRIWVQ